MNNAKAYKIKIFGKVQGVFMRKTLQDFANELDLVGYAENMPDGTVECVVQGSELQLTQFLNYCKQGSQFANVEAIDYEEIEPKNYSSFEIR